MAAIPHTAAAVKRRERGRYGIKRERELRRANLSNAAGKMSAPGAGESCPDFGGGAASRSARRVTGTSVHATARKYAIPE